MLRTEMALAQAPNGSPNRHHLEQVLNSCERARDLVKHLITFSHMTEQERKPLHLSLVVKEALKLLRASLPSALEIRLTGPYKTSSQQSSMSLLATCSESTEYLPESICSFRSEILSSLTPSSDSRISLMS
jgi:signal transduction histidine kinase